MDPPFSSTRLRERNAETARELALLEAELAAVRERTSKVRLAGTRYTVVPESFVCRQRFCLSGMLSLCCRCNSSAMY
jgi:hypothetical protein